MENSNLTILSLLIATPISFLVFRLIFKKSISFHIAFNLILMALIVALGTTMKEGITNKYFDFISKPFGVGIIVLMVLYLRKIIISPIQQLTQINKELARGNTKIKLNNKLLKSKSEIGDISKSVDEVIQNMKQSIEVANKVSKGFIGFEENEISGEGDLDKALRNMVVKLKEVISDISSAAENVASGSEQISQSSQSLSEGSNEQAASTEEASSSLEQMAASINQNTENAEHTNKITKDVKNKIEMIMEAVSMTNLAMNSIVEKIGVVNDIADKTDLLAINAAIEAARAGEHGKGFAVVASEVRELAESSLKSASEIEILSKDSLDKAENSNKLLIELAPEIRKATELIEEITAATMEQNAGINQINVAIQQLNEVTQNNSAISEEMSTSSEELAGQAEQLYESLSYFKTSKDELDQYDIAEIEGQIKKFQSLLTTLKDKKSKTKSSKKGGKTNKSQKTNTIKTKGKNIQLDDNPSNDEWEKY